MNYDEVREMKLVLTESVEHFKRVNERLDTIEKVNYRNLFFVSLHFSSNIRLDILFMFLFLDGKAIRWTASI